ncbi:MAG: hypothetical protein LR011_03630 [Verrucomicrobia bacterium]|nr:hypothetical protein [Verrucomicrobiota bacterium]
MVVIGIGLVAKVLPLARRSSPQLSGILICIAGLGVAATISLHSNLATKIQNQQFFAQKAPAEAGVDGYVQSESCRPCHGEAYSSWHESFHRTMTQMCEPAAVQADFSSQTLTLDGVRYTLFRDGDSYLVDMPDPNSAASGSLSGRMVRRRLSLITGSHHMQVFWVPDEKGNFQFPFPFAWLVGDERWVPTRDTFLRDPALGTPGAEWNLVCIRCHAVTGQPRPNPTTAQFETRVGELGIACEACHGPGENHVSQNSHPVHRYLNHFRREPESGLVNPLKLNSRRSSEVCGQCHSIRFIPDNRRFEQEGSNFRPGDILDSRMPVVQPSTFFPDKKPVSHPAPDKKYVLDRYWSDGEVRVTGREYNGMIDSPCYIRGEMSCLSCHSMHHYENVDDQIKRGLTLQQSCIQCHREYESMDTQTAHSHHSASSSGNQCVNCHMPHTVYGILKNVRSHTISSPSVQNQLETGRPNACNLCHLDQTLKWTAEALHNWHDAPVPSIPEAREDVADSLWNLLTGDAGQRSISAWHLGWSDAVENTGEGWQIPWLAIGMQDPYSAVRYISHKSLARIPEYQAMSQEYDYIGTEEQRTKFTQNLMDHWKAGESSGRISRSGGESPASALLLSSDLKDIDLARVAQFLSIRNNQSIDLQE